MSYEIESVPDEWATTKCDIAHIFLQQTLEINKYEIEIKMLFNPNLHEGRYFSLLSFLGQILSVEFLSKFSKLFWK